MKHLLTSFLFVAISTITQGQKLYGLCTWEKADEKIVYVSWVFKYEEDGWTGYGQDNKAAICSCQNSLKIEVGSKYKQYQNTMYLRKDRNMFYPYTEDEANKLRIKIISDYRSKDYQVSHLSVVYDKKACE